MCGKASPELIEAGSIPRLRDQSQVGESRIGHHIGGKHGIVEIHASVAVPDEHRGKIETESIDAHVVRPVSKRVEHQPAYGPIRTVQSVPGSGEVLVSARLGTGDHVIRAVVDATERVHRAVGIALRRVVVHDTGDYLDVRLVKGADHLPEFVVLATQGSRPRIPLVRREEVQGHVAPVAAFLWIVLQHRHQFDDGDAQVLQVRNLLDDAAVSAASLVLHSGVRIHGERSDVELVDHRIRLVDGPAIARPVEARFESTEIAERRLSGGASRFRSGIAIERLRKKNRCRVWIKEDLVGIEPVPFCRDGGWRARDPVGVVASSVRAIFPHPAVPDESGLVPEMIEIGTERGESPHRLPQTAGA